MTDYAYCADSKMSYGQDSDREKTNQAGFDAYLVKPVELDALIQLLASNND